MEESRAKKTIQREIVLSKQEGRAELPAPIGWMCIPLKIRFKQLLVSVILIAQLPNPIAAQTSGTSANEAPASETDGPSFSTIHSYPFRNTWSNFKESFSLHNTLYYHVPAIASTVLLTATDWDYDIQYATQKHETMPPELNEAFFVAGWFAPVVISGGLYSTGLLAGNDTMSRAGAASIQAMILTFGVTTAGKILTGRRGPDKNLFPGANPQGNGGGFKRTRSANDYNFAFWENFNRSEGRFFWPSGHTSSMFAVAAAMTASTRDPAVGIISYSLAGYMGWAMIDGDHHWASDVIAGALLGQVIGWTVGTSYASQTKLSHRKESRGLDSFRLMPVSGPVNGAAAQWLF
jgi:membrane-associated phospholipid phosphatase